MDNFTSPTGSGINQSSVGAIIGGGESNHYNGRKYDTNEVDKDTEVAMGTASLGRAAQPPPSERSSTLDAKDSRRPLLDEEAYGFDISPVQSMSAASSSALLITGAIQSRRRVPRLAAVSIVNTPPPLRPTPTTENETSLGQIIPPLSSGHDQHPPVPPRPWHRCNINPASYHDYMAPPLSPLRDRDPAPPLPPKTYLKDFLQVTPALYCDAPPLPQRLYLPENEEAKGLQLSIEELDRAGVLHNSKPETLKPLEEEGEEGENCDEIACSSMSLTTVLLPREFKHSSTAPCNLHMMYVESNCYKCQKMKKIVGMLLDEVHICDCCKKKKVVARRSST